MARYSNYLIYLDDFTQKSKETMKKISFDNEILWRLQIDDNPHDCTMWNRIIKYFDENTFDDAVKEYSKVRPIHPF
jgi:hypothetical protein